MNDQAASAAGENLDPVAMTGRLTAAMRARETARPDRLFDDPLAATLAGGPGRALLEEMDMADNPTIPVRTRFYDDVLSSGDPGVPRQIVLLAAGMDTRVYRLDLPADSTVFELDRPEVLRFKETRLAGTPAGPPRARRPRRPVGVDLAADWTPALTAAGFRGDQPTCWVVEGLTQYLTAADVHRLLDRITDLSVPQSCLLIDFVGRSLLESPVMRPMLDEFATRGMTWVYGTEEPEELLAGRGWHPDITLIASFGRALGRWPFPDLPHGAPGVPHGYLVRATR